MANESQLLQLIAAIHEAAGEPQRWPACLAKIGDLLRGHVVALFAYDLRSARGSVAYTVGYDPELQRKYEDYYSARNVWMARGRHLLQPGRVRTSEMMCSASDLVRTEFYADYLQRMDAFHGIGATLLRDEFVASNFTVLRAPCAGPFEGEEIAVLEALVPHLQTALRLHHRLVSLDERHRALSEALDRIPWGIVVLDVQLKIQTLNAAARAMFDQRDGLVLDGQVPSATPTSMRAALQRVLRDAVAGAAGSPTAIARALTIARPSGKQPYSVLVAPLHHLTRQELNQSAVVMFITDPELRPKLPATVLMQTYGLTAAEARLAQALMRGKNLVEAADEIGVTRNTAKSQLQRIFDKTSTNRQAELLRLLVTSLSAYAAQPR
jgi:DNA-binding CsgD family transcriptional regulator/PAS domain-containing protein